MAPLGMLLSFTVIESTVVEILHYFSQPEKNDVHRDELIRKMQYIYTVEYYSPMNRNINMESVHKWVDHKNYTEQDNSSPEMQIYFL